MQHNFLLPLPFQGTDLQSTSNEEPRQRSHSIQDALEGSNMVKQDVIRERTFSGTIWDSPDELEQEKEKYLQNGHNKTYKA